MSILNIILGVSKINILILNKLLHSRAVPGVEFVISIPETCSLYTCIQYSDTHDSLLTQMSDKLLTRANILLFCQPPLKISFSCTDSIGVVHASVGKNLVKRNMLQVIRSYFADP
jgi:hypothetical protein